MNNKIRIPCPYCLGSGKILAKRGISDDDKKKMLAMRRQGLTFRQIAGKMQIKHPQSVKSAIEVYVKKQIKKEAINANTRAV